MIAIRGATTISQNTSSEIKSASLELFTEILHQNNIKKEDISIIIFSCTSDINAEYPGKFIREAYNLNNIAIMHFNEMEVKDLLPLCIRILIVIDAKPMDMKFIYLHGAKALRKDLLDK